MTVPPLALTFLMDAIARCLFSDVAFEVGKIRFALPEPVTMTRGKGGLTRPYRLWVGWVSWVGWGGFTEIFRLPRVWLVNPPLQAVLVGYFGWGGFTEIFRLTRDLVGVLTFSLSSYPSSGTDAVCFVY
jgi:hypothetical protein